VAALGSRPNLRDGASVIASLATFAAVLTLLDGVIGGARPAITLLEVMPGLVLRFEIEPLGMLFATVASGLWIATAVYSIGYMRGANEKNQTRFYICFAIAIAAALGIAFSGNLFTLFIFYEVLTISTYPLVAHKETPEARKGARIYLAILMTTSILFLLVAVIWTWNIAGTMDFRAGGILEGKIDPAYVPFLLALFAFGIGKAALMPFHRWLPAAMVAPTPVSALLHAVAVVKAGVFTMLKVGTYIFGVGFLGKTGAADWLMWLAAASILIASLVAVTKDDLKARLAYSTVSQLSYITLGVALANQMGVIGGSMHIVMHAMGKITLFMCAGAIYVAAHKTKVSELDGLGRKMPITFICFTLAALSIIGLPPFGGAWSKWYLMLSAAEADQLVIIGVLMVSSLLNVAYLLPIPARAFFAPARGQVAHSLGAAAAPVREGIE
ncbi:MAG: proton-conducting transporter membrane subunit, partial [Parvibaculum sp.]